MFFQTMSIIMWFKFLPDLRNCFHVIVLLFLQLCGCTWLHGGKQITLIVIHTGGQWTETMNSVYQLQVMKIVWKDLFQAVLAPFLSLSFYTKEAGLTSTMTVKSFCWVRCLVSNLHNWGVFPYSLPPFPLHGAQTEGMSAPRLFTAAECGSLNAAT